MKKRLEDMLGPQNSIHKVRHPKRMNARFLIWLLFAGVLFLLSYLLIGHSYPTTNSTSISHVDPSDDYEETVNHHSSYEMNMSEDHYEMNISEDFQVNTSDSYKRNVNNSNPVISVSRCDFYKGKWIYDDSYPLYRFSTCPIIEGGFRCQENGRPDKKYMKWRWQPSDCNIPRFDAEDMLRRLEGMRVTFVGDSMGRTQWESLICMLMQAVPDRRSVFEVNNNTITKNRPYTAYRFSSYNLTIEHYRSPFLVQVGRPTRHVPKRVRTTLKLDKLDFEETKWRSSDVLVFNTGHWWNPSKLFNAGWYFQVGDSLKLGMKIKDGYQAAIKTWASWVDNQLDTNRTLVFFRSYAPSHWDWPAKKCMASLDLSVQNLEIRSSEESWLMQKVIEGMKKPVIMLNVTALSNLRIDGHIGSWGNGNPPLDCAHWCLPGVPDIWNELLYASLTDWKRPPSSKDAKM